MPRIRGGRAAPQLQQTAPSDNSTGVAVNTNLILTFNEAVKAGTGSIQIRNAANGSLVQSIAVTDTSKVTFAGNQLTINPGSDLSPDTSYYVTFASGVVRDLANNAHGGISSPTAFNFSTGSSSLPADTTAPLLTGTTPADHATGIDTSANVVLTFNEAVKAGSGNIEIRRFSDGVVVQTIAVTDASRVSFSGNQMTINPPDDLTVMTGYYVTFGSGVVRDLANNAFTGIAPTAFIFTTGNEGDVTGPLLTGTSPADNATGVAVGTNLVLTFNEAVKAGAGNIRIVNADNGNVEKDVSIWDTSQVSFSGNQLTINPTTDLQLGTNYYVLFSQPQVITDLAGNNFGAILSSITFNFATAAPPAASLAKSGPEFLANTTTDGGQHNPSVGALTNGNFVIAWSDFSSSSDELERGGSSADF